MVAALVVLLGWQTYLIAIWPAALIAGSAGVFMFYVQHQFEDMYWVSGEDWSYDDAALKGSSYLKLPKILQFFSGNIGFHHVHHLSARIPNYNLQRAHEEHAVFRSVPTLTLASAVPTVRLKLWDESTGRLVTFREARAMRGARP
jgi:omega-6 fatty acid desaturase (delta-12 desaturase)